MKTIVRHNLLQFAPGDVWEKRNKHGTLMYRLTAMEHIVTVEGMDLRKLKDFKYQSAYDVYLEEAKAEVEKYINWEQL